MNKYSRYKTAGKVAKAISGIASDTKDKKIILKTLNLMESYKGHPMVEEVAHAIDKSAPYDEIDTAIEILQLCKDKKDLDQVIERIKKHIGCSDVVAFKEGIKLVNENLREPLSYGAFVPLVEAAKHFKKHLWPFDKLFNQDKSTYSDIARAHAICEKNCPDEMDEFYSNLKQKLDSGEAKDWAKAAYDAFQKNDDPSEMTVIERIAHK